MTLEFESCTVACFGRALIKEGDRYRPTNETARRAHEVGRFWHSAYQSSIQSIVCTGGYPKSMLHMEKPPNGISEAKFQRDIIVEQCGVPDKLVSIEKESTNTIRQFFYCIKNKMLRVGAYTAEHPVVFSMSTTNSWRNGLIAHVLDIAPGGMYRLRPGNDPWENSQQAQMRERDLTVVVKLAIDMLRPAGKPTNAEEALKYLDALQTCFRRLWRAFDSGELGSFEKFMSDHHYSWPIIEVPVLNY